MPLSQHFRQNTALEGREGKDSFHLPNPAEPNLHCPRLACWLSHSPVPLPLGALAFLQRLGRGFLHNLPQRGTLNLRQAQGNPLGMATRHKELPLCAREDELQWQG